MANTPSGTEVSLLLRDLQESLSRNKTRIPPINQSLLEARRHYGRTPEVVQLLVDAGKGPSL